MRQYFVNKKNKDYFYLDNQDVHHCIKVLRKRMGDQLICVFKSEKFLCEIIEINKSEVICKILNHIKSPIQNYVITIFFPIDKQKVWDLVIEKLTELNCDMIVPVYFARCQRNEKINWNRLEKITYAACKQANRIKPLEILKPISFDELSAEITKYDFVFFGNEKTINNLNFKNEFQVLKSEKKLAGIIGPAGGFIESELNFLIKKTNGIKLSDNILRSATAALTLINYLHFIMQET